MKQTEFAKMVDELIDRRESFAVATVVKTIGSSLGKPGFKEVISKEGEVVLGSLGGVCPDSAIVEIAKKTMVTGSPRTAKVYLEDVEKAVAGVVKSTNEDEIHVAKKKYFPSFFRSMFYPFQMPPMLLGLPPLDGD